MSTRERSTSSAARSNGASARTAEPPSGASGADPSRRVFLVTAALVGAAALFLAGVYVANARPAPYRLIERHVEQLREAWELGGFFPEHAINPAPEGAAREPWNALRPDALLPGHRVLTGYMSEANAFGVWILDERGRRVHERVLDYAALDPDGPSGGSESPHAFLVLPDGSAIVNVDKGDAIARYDVCGRAIWSREGAFHHSLASDPEGGVWTWQGEVSTFDQYQSLVRFDPDTGETLETIRLVEDIVERSVESRLVFSVAPGQTLERRDGERPVPDLFHPNDLEVLDAATAAAFPMFEAGDLLLSFRTPNLVAVVDRESHALKWWSHGPWRRQHDPDFLPDGRLSVFDNDTGRGTSNILFVTPASGALDVLDIEPRYRFYTRFMGKHEWLDADTVQIVVPYEGRVLEVGTDGRVALEINNVHDARHNGLVSDAARLPPGFFETPPEGFRCERERARG